MLLAASLLVGGPSLAATLTFSDSALFHAALPGPGSTLDFEAFPTNVIIPSGTSVGGITVSYSIAGESLKITNAYDTTSGVHSIGLTGGSEALLDGDVIQAAFDAPGIAALGLFVITSDFASPDEIELVTPVGTARNAAHETILGDGGIVYFVGLVSTAGLFSEATLQFADDGQTNFEYNVDDVVTALPEPGTLLLCSSGLVVLAARRRRERRT